MVQRLKRMENMRSPSSRILRIVTNPNPTGGIKATDNAAFAAQPQGYGVVNRLAEGPRWPTDLASIPDSKPFQCGGIVAGDRTGGHQLTQSWSHGLVIGP